LTTTGTGSESTPSRVSVALVSNRIVKGIAIIAALFTIYTEGATAYLNTEEAIKTKAAAANAASRQGGEARQAEQQARTQLEVARNAVERLKGEADKAEADARKAQSDAETAIQTARNAQLKTRSDALSIKYEAEIRHSKAISELEAARVAARKFKAAADVAENKNKLLIGTLDNTIRDWGMSRCPGKTPIEKINAKDQGRC